MTVGVETQDLTAAVEQAAADAARLQTEQVRAEAQAASADDEFARAVAKLKEEFGVDTATEARALLSELDRQVIDELAVVRAKLAEVGASGAVG